MSRPSLQPRVATSEKLTITCLDWRPLCRHTLRGFAAIKIAELRMSAREIAVHERNGKAWAQLPARPWIKDGQLVIGDDKKPQYTPLFEFDSYEVRARFSRAVVNAVLARHPDALTCREDVA